LVTGDEGEGTLKSFIGLFDEKKIERIEPTRLKGPASSPRGGVFLNQTVRESFLSRRAKPIKRVPTIPQSGEGMAYYLIGKEACRNGLRGEYSGHFGKVRGEEGSSGKKGSLVVA